MRLLLLALVLAASPVLAQDPVGFGFMFHEDAEGWVMVTGIAPGGAAETAGLQAGDLLVTVAGDSVFASGALDQLRAARESLPAAVRVARGVDTLDLVLGVAPYRPADLLRDSNATLCLAGDCWNGTGLWRHPNGDWYEGTFVEGVREGGGVFTLADGRIYSGGYARGLFHGRGTYFWPDGSRWTGTFLDDRPQAPGVYTDEHGVSRPGLPD